MNRLSFTTIVISKQVFLTRFAHRKRSCNTHVHCLVLYLLSKSPCCNIFALRLRSAITHIDIYVVFLSIDAPTGKLLCNVLILWNSNICALFRIPLEHLPYVTEVTMVAPPRTSVGCGTNAMTSFTRLFFF